MHINLLEELVSKGNITKENIMNLLMYIDPTQQESVLLLLLGVHPFQNPTTIRSTRPVKEQTNYGNLLVPIKEANLVWHDLLSELVEYECEYSEFPRVWYTSQAAAEKNLDPSNEKSSTHTVQGYDMEVGRIITRKFTMSLHEWMDYGK